uniref:TRANSKETOLASE_1 domain-containing protein n=1 Tax=Heterorhabditis bacteriophora TaxID=37862 RepID=A0A1I7XU33_HETBA
MDGSRQPPGWKNPRERLRRHLTRKSSTRCLDASLNSSTAISEKIETESYPPVPSSQLASNNNPFRRGSPVKKKYKGKSSQESDELKYLPVDWDDSNANDPFSNTVIEVDCFDHLFLSWKKGDRKSFYVACPTFTVLFTKSSEINDLDLGEDSMSCFQTACGLKHVAIVTPTNSGFRQYLKSEGVEMHEEISISYDICNSKKRRLSKSSFKLDDSNLELSGVTESQPPVFDRAEREIEAEDRCEEKENGIKDNSDSEGSPDKLDQSADHDWLETMGVSPSNTARLRRYKSMGGSSTNLNSLGGESKMEKEKTTSILIKKSSQVLKRNATEYIVEMEGGPVLPHAVTMAAEFVRQAGLCEEYPVIIRVNDRNACNGLNGLSENPTEWTEISVEAKTIRWNA